MTTANWIKDYWTMPRWHGITRHYTAEEVVKLRGTWHIDYSLADQAATKLWHKLVDAYNNQTAVRALGALTGNQAIQIAQAKLPAIYLSGWQIAADHNLSLEMYPDQSLYPANSVPVAVQAINNALHKADQIQTVDNLGNIDYQLPIIADAEAGFGGNLNAYELMRKMIEAGAAGVHFEDQLSSAKKCGHLGGKVLVPTSEFINKLKAARLATDVMDVPTIIIARTDADSAKLITANIDPLDTPFIDYTANITSEGFYEYTGGIKAAIARAIAYAPYADLIWCETAHPSLEEAKEFAEGVHKHFPNKMLAYNCSPSFNWKANEHLTGPLAEFQNELAKMGYAFQFVTLAGFHTLNHAMFSLAVDYLENGMAAYSKLQQSEFNLVKQGFTAVKHQQFVGTSYFDTIQNTINSSSSTMAMSGSTEQEQF